MCGKYDLASVFLQHMTFYLLHKNNFFLSTVLKLHTNEQSMIFIWK